MNAVGCVARLQGERNLIYILGPYLPRFEDYAASHGVSYNSELVIKNTVLIRVLWRCREYVSQGDFHKMVCTVHGNAYLAAAARDIHPIHLCMYVMHCTSCWHKGLRQSSAV